MAGGVVTVSVAVGIVTGVMTDGIIRPFALIALVLAAVALLGTGLVFCQSMVDELDETDPLRASHGGAFGPTIRRALRLAGGSLVREGRELLAALRRDITRESLARLARGCADALSGVPPAEVSPPPSAGLRARPDRVPRWTARPRATPRATPRLRRAPSEGVAAARRRHPSRGRRLPA